MRRSTLWVMAIASAFAVANLYYNQPLLAAITQSLHASAQQVGLIPALTQAGYALGLLLFVPLGDRVDARRRTVGLEINLLASSDRNGDSGDRLSPMHSPERAICHHTLLSTDAT